MQKINKETYLLLREEKLKKIQASEQNRDLCLKCFRAKKNCFCAYIKKFDPQMKIVILMHPMELKRERVGTGRLCELSLQDSEIIMGVNFTDDKRVNALIHDEEYFSVVLYPGNEAMNISQGEFSKFDLKGKKLLIFVIDGTWPCAKKMMRESQNLHHLPRLSFDIHRQSEFAIKQQPGEFCLSTIEALHELLCVWERQGNANYGGAQEGLMDVFRELVKFQIKCSEDPNLQSYRKKKSFSSVKERKISKKWEKRKIFF